MISRPPACGDARMRAVGATSESATAHWRSARSRTDVLRSVGAGAVLALALACIPLATMADDDGESAPPGANGAFGLPVAAGQTGVTSAPGAPWARGATGATGPTGPTGPMGLPTTGPPGPRGPQGPPGPAGPAGGP